MKKVQILKNNSKAFRAAILMLLLVATSNSLKATCTPPTVTSTTPGTRCGYGTVTLGATASSGTINWYANPTGGSSLGSGNTFTTPNISSTTNFYAEPGTVSTSTDPVGVATTTSSTASPYRSTGTRGARIQMLFRAAELTAAGFTAGNISAISWNVTSGTSTYNGFSIGLANTASTAFSGTAFLSDAVTTVYSVTSYTSVVGANTHTFSTSFNWDGTSNLLVQVCYGTASANSTVSTNSPGFNGYTGATTTGSCSGLGSANAARPLTTFTHQVSCLGTRSTVTATVDTTGVPTAFAIGNSPVCQGGTINLNGAINCNCTPTNYSWTGPNGFNSTNQSPVITNVPVASSGTYTFQAFNNACASTPSTVAITVTPGPPTTVSPSSPSICQGGSVTLSSGGAIPSGYCSDVTQFGCVFTAGGTITNVTFGGINRTSSCDNTSNGYSLSTSPNPLFLQAGTYSLSITYTTTSFSSASLVAYIDFNRNGVLNDAGETVLLTTVAASTTATATAPVTIPQNCAPGFTLMRIKLVSTSLIAPCSSNTFGEIEDYYITLDSTTYAWAPATGLNTTTGNVVQASPSSTTTYTVTATDNNSGCTSSSTVTVNVSLPFTLSASSTAASCNGGNNGTASVTATGGASPYAYRWSNGATSTSVSATNTISNLTAGTYAVTVSSGVCVVVQSGITVTQPSALTVSKSVTHVSCNGGNNGSITASVSGGTSPYSYAWTNTATTSSITNLNANQYSLTVTDSHGCSSTSSTQITQPPVLNTTSSITHVSCAGGSNGSVTVTASGGTAPYSGTGTFSGLTAGTYNYVVTDNHGCTTTASATVTEPSPFTAAATTIANVSCNGGSNGQISVTASGGTPAYSGTGTFSNLIVGTYTFTVTDSHGCTATATADVTSPTAIAPSAGSNSPVCNGDNINLTSSVSGGISPYSYAWTGPNGFASTDANPVIASAAAANSGVYSFTATDANNCTATTTTTVTVINCTTTLNLKLMIEGYYIGSGQMNSALFNEGVSGTTTSQTDTIIVDLHDATTPYALVASVKAMVMTNGNATAVFGPTINGGSYYIAVKHRNSIETWSAAPVAFTFVTSYDFTPAQSQAYGNNQTLVDVNMWAFYSGDINQDGNVDLIDFPALDFGINHGLFGYYAADLNGDGNVDLLDFPVLDANINGGVFVIHP